MNVVTVLYQSKKQKIKAIKSQSCSLTPSPFQILYLYCGVIIWLLYVDARIFDIVVVSRAGGDIISALGYYDAGEGRCSLCRGLLLQVFGVRGALLALEEATELAEALGEEVVGYDERPTDSLGDLGEERVGEESDGHGPRETEEGDDDADGPLHAVDGLDLERGAPDEDDGDLRAHHDEVDNDEEDVAVDALQDVELVVQAAVVELVEDLHPDEGVEHHSVELQHLIRVLGVVAQNLGSGEVQDERHRQLENGLPDDHLPHVYRHQGRTLGLGFAVQNFLSRGVGCKCQRSERVHDEIDPKKLYRCKHRLHRLG